MIEGLRVRIPAGAAREFSSPELTLRADSYSVSIPPPCYRSGTNETSDILPKSAGGRLHLNTYIPLTQRRHSVGTYQRRKRAHAQLAREHSDTVVSAR